MANEFHNGIQVRYCKLTVLNSRQQNGKEFLASNDFNLDTFSTSTATRTVFFCSCTTQWLASEGELPSGFYSRCFGKLQGCLKAVAVSSVHWNHLFSPVDVFKTAVAWDTSQTQNCIISETVQFQKVPQVTLSHSSHQKTTDLRSVRDFSFVSKSLRLKGFFKKSYVQPPNRHLNSAYNIPLCWILFDVPSYTWTERIAF